MTKKKWIVLGSIIAVVVFAVVGVLIFKDDIFEDGGKGNYVRVSIERQSADADTTFDKLGNVTTSQVSGEYEVGSNPKFVFTPTQMGCIYSIRVNDEEVYDYLSNPDVDVTKPFEYTIKNIQKETRIIVTFDRRGDASKLNQIVDCTSLLTITEEGTTSATLSLHDIVMGNNFTGEVGGKTLLQTLQNKGYVLNSDGKLVCGEVKLWNGGTVYPMHGKVKIKLEAYEGFEILGFSWPSTSKVQIDGNTGEISGVSIDKNNVVSGIQSVNSDSIYPKSTYYSSGNKYSNPDNPLAVFNPSDNTITVYNYSDFIDNNNYFEIFFLPQKVEVVDHYDATNFETTKTETHRLFDVTKIKTTTGYATTDGGTGNDINLNESKKEKLVHLSYQNEAQTFNYVDSYAGYILLTKDLIYGGKITLLLDNYEK